jgi:hypothetical protein
MIIKDISVYKTVYWTEASELFPDDEVEYRATGPQVVERNYGSWEYEYDKKFPCEVMEIFLNDDEGGQDLVKQIMKDILDSDQYYEISSFGEEIIRKALTKRFVE